eukprot:3077023-Rhodomonas_salina.4
MLRVLHSSTSVPERVCCYTSDLVPGKLGCYAYCTTTCQYQSRAPHARSAPDIAWHARRTSLIGRSRDHILDFNAPLRR